MGEVRQALHPKGENIMFLKKAEIHLKKSDSGKTISNFILKVKPWVQYAILIDKDAENVTIENGYIERLTWTQWFTSLFKFKVHFGLGEVTIRKGDVSYQILISRGGLVSNKYNHKTGLTSFYFGA
jgi:hypothetical protein